MRPTAAKSTLDAKMEFKTSAGYPLPMGVTCRADGCNFAIFARHAEAVWLVLFRSGVEEPVAELAFDPSVNKTGNVWHILIRDFDPQLRYGYRMAGPYDPHGSGHWYQPDKLLLDPYAKALTGGSEWGMAYCRTGLCGPLSTFQRRCLHVENDFDWEGDRPLNIPLKDTVIYELHVRGFTRHRSAKVDHPGTYRGVIEKIPHLKKLGITAVELLPVAEFNEHESTFRNPETGQRLRNFWGYSPLSFCAPKAAYAVNGRNGEQVREFKEMVKGLHKAGIEVILDVVFNHTAEGGANGPVISFRGIDNTIYYLLDEKSRDYLNFSGCGNTVNCNHPWVRHLILDCLRYWVVEMHVDGFRFDLASILGRGPKGEVLANPPMVEKIAEDPILAHTKIIAEAWDAAGLYQVGSFSSHFRWAEWNGHFRDDVRAFLCGHEGTVPQLATRIAGSADLYQEGRHPFNSINFLTSHDGFTLYDLVSYNEKHNEANGEGNRDGLDYNLSWNSGAEGETDDPAINTLRMRRIRTGAVILMLSQGVPMFVAGDEFGRTQHGNNNAWCQDNETGWVDWRLATKNHDLLRFFRLLISLRRHHAVFRRRSFFPPPGADNREEIFWHGTEPGQPDWSPAAKTLAFHLAGAATEPTDHDFVVLLNCHRGSRLFATPTPPKGTRWHRLIDTAAASPRDIVPEHESRPLTATTVTVAGFGAVVLMAR